jgi:riboflavin kinase/FMN adenylyltransferase
MEVVDELARCPHPAEGTIVTIGAYDGVHVGHRRLIEKMRALAAERGCASAVVTFDRHPALVVRPDSAPKLLTDLDTKLELLEETGVDYVVVIHFDKERSTEPAADFVQTVLVACLNAKGVVVGHDFHFGHKREGNVALLEQLGPSCGFSVLGLDLFGSDGSGSEASGSDGSGSDASGSDADSISSTRIRSLLGAGAVEEAAKLLGRPHRIRGIVRRGDGRARELGFPTANLAVSDELCLAADGVYAGWYWRGSGGRYPAAISIGTRPTFYADGDVLVEAYLLDFDGDLYDEQGTVELTTRLRGQERFVNVDDLIEHMRADVEAARAALTA